MTTGSRGNTRSPGRTPPFILIGLLVIVGFLSYSYWSLSNANSELAAELDSMQIQKKEIDQRTYDTEKSLENAREDGRAAQGQLDQTRKQLQDKDAELASVKADLSGKQADADKYQNQLTQCDTSLAEQKSILDALKNEKGEFEHLLNDLRQKQAVCDGEACLGSIREILIVVAKKLGTEVIGRALFEANLDAGKLLEGIEFPAPVVKQPAVDQLLLGQNQQPLGQNQQPLDQNQQPLGQNQEAQGQNQQPLGQNQEAQGQNQQPQGQNQQPQPQIQQLQGQNQQPQAQIQQLQGQNQQQADQNQQQAAPILKPEDQDLKPQDQDQQLQGQNQQAPADQNQVDKPIQQVNENQVRGGEDVASSSNIKKDNVADRTVSVSQLPTDKVITGVLSFHSERDKNIADISNLIAKMENLEKHKNEEHADNPEKDPSHNDIEETGNEKHEVKEENAYDVKEPEEDVKETDDRWKRE